jgi:hypothetical protein
VGEDVSVDSDALLMIDFVNLKIKPAQSFKVECSSIYEYLRLYCVSKNKNTSKREVLSSNTRKASASTLNL